MIKKLFPFLCLLLVTVAFFWQFLLKGLLPIPADTIVGLYHPYRDLYSKDYPRGIPFKNSLITDPVRQQYPWRKLSIESLKNLELPSWNPYSFAGTPNIANFQSAVFYPFNILFVFLSFNLSWGLIIMLEPLLGGIFLYLYLKNLKLDNYSSFFGAVVFSFSGFFTTWLEWGNVIHAALWLPLILLSIDKLSNTETNKSKYSKNLAWSLILIFSAVSSFFAGHLQTFFYSSIVVFFYFLLRFWRNDKRTKLLLIILSSLAIAFVLVLPQFIPTIKFILLSGREADQMNWQKIGWFIPWKHAIQFLAPDFFGNPATINYWGIWNYGEFTGYVGILPLILASYTFFLKRINITIFYSLILLFSLVFAFPTFIAKLPFALNIPFLSTTQPTRLTFLIDFSLSVLSAYGLNHYASLLKNVKVSKEVWKMFMPIGGAAILFSILFIFTMIGGKYGFDSSNLAIAKRNLIFPAIIFVCSGVLLLSLIKLNKKFVNYLLITLIFLTIIDLFRFSWKFNTFSKKEYLYPSTTSLTFIQKNIGINRLATTDTKILAPNFSIMHGIQSVEGYDPLFSQRYAEFISAINRNEPNVNPPFGFNRIVRLENISSNLVDLLGVKYVLSLTDINNPKYKKVFEEGETKVYENKNVLPKAFFVNSVKVTSNKQNAINSMFDKGFDPGHAAVVEENVGQTTLTTEGTSAKIIGYSNNEVMIETNNSQDGFLVLTDSFYPTWHAKIDKVRETRIYRADYNFRGVFIPKGQHVIRFYNSLL